MAQAIIREANVAAAPWMRFVLILAGVYNLVWGAFVLCFPLLPFQWAQMELPRYPEIWQCVGMIVGVYGIGYIRPLAKVTQARHPERSEGSC